jgi:hypothetical protein
MVSTTKRRPWIAIGWAKPALSVVVPGGARPEPLCNGATKSPLPVEDWWNLNRDKHCHLVCLRPSLLSLLPDER